MNNAISLLDMVNFTYIFPGNKIPVLKNISISFKEGESVAFIGPSGAGKSTLLNHLKKKIPQASMVHQEYLLVPQLSVFHNIYMGRLDYHGLLYNLINLVLPIKNEKEKIFLIAEKLDIQKYLNIPCKNLSGGEQQRTAVARALYRDSEICFADEPVSAMDLENSEKTISLLKQKRIVMASMHNTDLALKHFDRIIALKEGTLFFNKIPSEVDSKSLKELYRE